MLLLIKFTILFTQTSLSLWKENHKTISLHTLWKRLKTSITQLLLMTNQDLIFTLEILMWNSITALNFQLARTNSITLCLIFLLCLNFAIVNKHAVYIGWTMKNLIILYFLNQVVLHMLIHLKLKLYITLVNKEMVWK